MSPLHQLHFLAQCWEAEGAERRHGGCYGWITDKWKALIPSTVDLAPFLNAALITFQMKMFSLSRLRPMSSNGNACLNPVVMFSIKKKKESHNISSVSLIPPGHGGLCVLYGVTCAPHHETHNQHGEPIHAFPVWVTLLPANAELKTLSNVFIVMTRY